MYHFVKTKITIWEKGSESMGLISELFGKKLKTPTKVESQLVDLFRPFFSSVSNPKLNDTLMSAVQTNATHCSKIQIVPLLNNKPTKPYLQKILSLSPNPITEAGAFYEKVARNYFLDNNAFIYLDWYTDSSKMSEPLRAMWIVDPTYMTVKYDPETGDFIYKIQVDGRIIYTSSENMIHIARHVALSELFGETSPAINKVISVINTNYDGVENAIRTSAFLRFILTTSTAMKEEDRKKKAQSFAETYLTKDGTGIAYLDSTTTFQKVDSSAKYANAEEMEFFEKKIKKYMNIDDPILLGNFNENQWQSYYETNLEPFILKLKNELERKLFTDREYSQGNRIHIASNMLQVASLATKNNLIMATKEIGIFSVNEYRQLLNMSPLDDGDTRYVSLNYADVDSAKKKQSKEGE